MKKGLPLLLFLVFAIILVGCGDKRDTSSLDTAIIGHWVSESDDPELEDTHYYISEDEFIMVDQGTESIADYEISATNKEENWIEINTEGRNDVGSLVRKLKFTDEDMTNITVPFDPNDLIFSNEVAGGQDNQQLVEAMKENLSEEDLEELESTWNYVDSKTEPED